MDRREITETAVLLVCTLVMLLVGLRMARALATLLAWAFVAVQ